MEINNFIQLIKKLENEKNKSRAAEQCKRLQEVAKQHNIPLTHIAEVYKQVLDSGIVNKNVLEQFKKDVNTNWDSKDLVENNVQISDIKISNRRKML